VQSAAAAVVPELAVLVVVDMADEERTPGQVAADIRRTLETGHARYLERVIHVEDLPADVQILAPGERNGRA
jgi:hypothetical protein